MRSTCPGDKEEAPPALRDGETAEWEQIQKQIREPPGTAAGPTMAGMGRRKTSPGELCLPEGWEGYRKLCVQDPLQREKSKCPGIRGAESSLALGGRRGAGRWETSRAGGRSPGPGYCNSLSQKLARELI